MRIAAPSCDDCNVWLILYMGERYICPVCEKEPKNGYTHLSPNATKVHNIDEVPFLRFMKGKSPNP